MPSATEASVPSALQGGPSRVVNHTWDLARRSAVVSRHAPVAAGPEVGAARGSWFDADAARTLFEANPCGVVLVTGSGVVVDANAAFIVITGRSWSELTGRTLEAVLHRTDGDTLGLPKIADTDTTDSLQVEREVLTPGGDRLVLELTVMPIGAGSELPLQAIQIVDVTAQRRVEHELRMQHVDPDIEAQAPWTPEPGRR